MGGPAATTTGPCGRTPASRAAGHPSPRRLPCREIRCRAARERAGPPSRTVSRNARAAAYLLPGAGRHPARSGGPRFDHLQIGNQSVTNKRVDPFTALADPVRRDLLRALASGPARVVDLAARHPISRPAVSKHLRLLAEAGLVTAEDRGRERHYALARSGLAPVRALLDELAGRRAPIPESAFDALDLEVRRTVHDRRTGTGAPTGTGRPQEESA